MKQFYEAYQSNEKLSAMLTEITWTNHLHIRFKEKKLEPLLKVAENLWLIVILRIKSMGTNYSLKICEKIIALYRQ